MQRTVEEAKKTQEREQMRTKNAVNWDAWSVTPVAYFTLLRFC